MPDDQEIVSKVVENQTKLQTLLNGFTDNSVLDTFQEIQNLIGLNGSLKNKIEKNKADISAEKSRAEAAEADIASSVVAEKLRSEAAEANVASTVVAEQLRAEGVEASIGSSVPSTSSPSFCQQARNTCSSS